MYKRPSFVAVGTGPRAEHSEGEVSNHLLGEGTLLDVKTLEGCLGVAESKVNFVTNHQTED